MAVTRRQFLIGAGLASFAALAHLFGAARVGELKTLLRRDRSSVSA